MTKFNILPKRKYTVIENNYIKGRWEREGLQQEKTILYLKMRDWILDMILTNISLPRINAKLTPTPGGLLIDHLFANIWELDTQFWFILNNEQLLPFYFKFFNDKFVISKSTLILHTHKQKVLPKFVIIYILPKPP